MGMLTLLDKGDNKIGYLEKGDCHRIPVKLHRAFSISISNSKKHISITRDMPARKPGLVSGQMRAVHIQERERP